MTPSKLYIAINKEIINKIPAGSGHLWNSFKSNFKNVAPTIHELSNYINEGFAVSAQHVGDKLEANFLRTNFLWLDVDGGLTIEQALAHPFIQTYASLLYVTQSHTELAHRYRLGFTTERIIETAEEMRNLLTGLIHLMGADESCKDPCRGYFGSRGSNPLILDGFLPNNILDDLIASGKIQNSSQPSVASGKLKTIRTSKSPMFTLEDNHLVRLARNNQPFPFYSLSHGTSVYCPFHNDKNPSAFITTNTEGVLGVHCHTCDTTFWPEDENANLTKYNFYSYEQFMLTESYRNNMSPDIKPNEILKKTIPSIQNFLIFDQKYIPNTIGLDTGVTFMRSPKGSGKTQWLISLVKTCIARSETVLLIGHRRSLIQGIAKRLGLQCYFESTGEKTEYHKACDHYAISVDSISVKLDPKINKYDLVIIDESEQVFAHSTSDTLNTKRRAVVVKLFHYLKRARYIVLTDADLDMITVSTVYNAVGSNIKFNFYLNTYKEKEREISLYQSEEMLMQELKDSVSSGGRYFVSTNSRKKAKLIFEILIKIIPSTDILLVTSETTSTSPVQKLLNSPIIEIVKYKVVIASPTMSTGIDLSFPDEEQLIDGVLGFYVGQVNTHFEIDQQLSRVRHPKFIKVWVCPVPYHLETDINVISDELRRSQFITDIIVEYDKDDMAVVDEKYLAKFSIVTSVDRASKNSIRKNFSQLRERNGWLVNYIDKNETDISAISDELIKIQSIIKQKQFKRIINANPISIGEYKILSATSKNAAISIENQCSMRKWEVEEFYKMHITEQLLELDDDGRYREKIRLLETHLAKFEEVKSKGLSERRSHILMPDRKFLATKKAAIFYLLKSAGISTGKEKIDINAPINNAILGNFVNYCKKHHSQISELLGINVFPKDLESKPTSTLHKILKAIGLCFVPAGRTKSKGVMTNHYKFDKLVFDTAMKIVDARKSIIISKPHILADAPFFNSRVVIGGAFEQDILTQVQEGHFGQIPTDKIEQVRLSIHRSLEF